MEKEKEGDLPGANARGNHQLESLANEEEIMEGKKEKEGDLLGANTRGNNQSESLVVEEAHELVVLCSTFGCGIKGKLVPKNSFLKKISTLQT